MRILLLATTGLSLLVAGSAGCAETLRDALVQMYNSNPTVMAQRAQVRSLDAGVAIARSQGRPLLTAEPSINENVIRSTRNTPARNIGARLDVSYPLFNGGAVRNSIRAADERVLAGRADLRVTEGGIIVETVAAYMDVIRDRAIVALSRNQAQVLGTNLQATSDRFEVGDVTRTDVAQSEARLALARSSVATAEGRLKRTEENYRRLVGGLPGKLEPPPPLPPLPQTPQEAESDAIVGNASLQSIQAQARATERDVSIARANRLPNVSSVSRSRFDNPLGSAPAGQGGSATTASGGVQARLPIYQGGLVGAQVRQRQATQSQVLERGVEIERVVVANTRAAFASYRAAQKAIEANETAVDANTLALEGTRAGQTIGTRNVLDVLNAEQELLSSQVALVTARRDAYVAGFQLLNAIGRAEADDLNLGLGSLYDPVENYNRITRDRSDWANDPQPAAVSRRTATGGAASPLAVPKN
jgi:outer membrane protein